MGFAHAADDRAFYVSLGLGEVDPGTSDFNASNNVQLPGDDFETIVNEEIDLDPTGSVAFSALVGWQAKDLLAFELEYALQHNDFDDDVVDDDFDGAFLFGLGPNYSVDLVSINAVVGTKVERGFRPYAGVGVGVMSFRPNEDQLDGFDGETVAGYQLKAGVEYNFANGLFVGFQARHMAGLEEFERSFSRDVLQPGGGTVATTLEESIDYSGRDVVMTAGFRF